MAISCLDQPDCFSLNNNIVGIAFKRLSTNRADTIGWQTITPAGTNIAYVPTPTTVTFVNVHVDPFSNSTQFAIEAGGKVYDLRLDYLSRPQFVSEDCGEKFVISDLKVFSEAFDSVRVAAPTPKSQPVTGTNIEVFRCPNTSTIKVRLSSAISIASIQTSYTTIATTPDAISDILLPLNTAESQSSITFNFTDGRTRTLVLNYERESRQLYHACGSQVVISELSVASHTFTDVKVTRTSIQDPNQVNLEITL
ncbi:MAG TPA: hypothetical protein VGD65_05130 [Chryseosolibacter sp.]